MEQAPGYHQRRKKKLTHDSIRCVDDKTAPIPDYLYSGMMTEKHGMPNAGGWLDQEAGLLERQEICVEAYQAYADFKRIEPGTGADWQRRNPHKWAIVADYLGLTDGTN